jgi:hypothetical protein
MIFLSPAATSLFSRVAFYERLFPPRTTMTIWKSVTIPADRLVPAGWLVFSGWCLFDTRISEGHPRTAFSGH